eukprot:CAMPEP_0197005916 /NCGR_PEP_ID=MMETSP1380-20130617/32044_1 /TAXON_ID=5936 /ORGANISM="Euplotes crassus, Strain CT5" /LENGTH=136 /DNA_ID=CAMNT_0042425251 /DNA_START=46 /DNA_END=453 /DNA_ORIENTATION=+
MAAEAKNKNRDLTKTEAEGLVLRDFVQEIYQIALATGDSSILEKSWNGISALKYVLNSELADSSVSFPGIRDLMRYVFCGTVFAGYLVLSSVIILVALVSILIGGDIGNIADIFEPLIWLLGKISQNCINPTTFPN